MLNTSHYFMINLPLQEVWLAPAKQLQMLGAIHVPPSAQLGLQIAIATHLS